MKSFKYIIPALLLGFAMTACDDDDTYGVLDGIDMVNRTQSIAEGATVRAGATHSITLAYNNVVELGTTPITLNGKTTTATVNPDNGMELIIDLNLEPYTDYTLEIPEGAVLIKENKSVAAPAKTIKFNTNVGADPSMVARQLTNANATAEAKKVYEYLVDNYGKTQLSGAMGEIAWGNGYTDLVASQAGHYPAIVGFDYIHLPYSPSNWINYGDITPVKRAWDNGSIPAFSWHWLVPENVVEGFSTVVSTTEKVIPSDWSDALILNDDAAKALFADAVAGCKVKVATKDVAAGAQGSFKDGASWGGLVDEAGVNYDYFDITGDYEMTLDATTAEAIRNNGLIVAGHDYTVVSVTLELPGGGSGQLAYNNFFDPAKAVTPGTVENDIVNADIARIAGYLKLLQDAGIPVLWRPFHEAAGDYGYGAWFWWGMGSVNDTKNLWSYLRNKLEGEYGLNNLIWVWTVQTYEFGSLTTVDRLREAYPGDDVVDIVCVDIYENSPLGVRSDIFDAVNTMVEKKKVVAIGECGLLLDPEAAAADSALWSYFMQWYDIDDNGSPAFNIYSSPELWKQVMESPLVKNQGDFNVK